MNVGYLISSHISYDAPRAHLLRSMGAIDALRVLVAVGGCDTDARDGLTLAVRHNSFDYTALIAFLELEASPAWSHVFLLHDTMEFRPSTDHLISAAPADAPAVAVWGGFCNLGLLRVDYLRSRATEVLSWRNCTKAEAVNAEGVLWRTAPPPHYQYPGTCHEIGTARPYGGAERVVEHYTGIDLVKYKANWGQNTSLDPSRWVVTP